MSRVTFSFAIRVYCFAWRCHALLHTCIHRFSWEDAIKPNHSECFAYEHSINQLHVLLDIHSLCAHSFICALVYLYKFYSILNYMNAICIYTVHSINILLKYACICGYSLAHRASIAKLCVCVCSKHFRWFWYTIQFVWFVAFALRSKWSPAEWKHVILVSKRICNSNIEFSSVWVDSVWLVQYTPHQRCIKLWES